MQKWEYKLISMINGETRIDGKLVSSVLITSHLNQLGSEGWELVSVATESVSVCIGGHADKATLRGGLFYYLKRPTS